MPFIVPNFLPSHFWLGHQGYVAVFHSTVPFCCPNFQATMASKTKFGNLKGKLERLPLFPRPSALPSSPKRSSGFLDIIHLIFGFSFWASLKLDFALLINLSHRNSSETTSAALINEKSSSVEEPPTDHSATRRQPTVVIHHTTMIDNLFGSNPENSGILVVGSLAALLGAHLVLSFILKSFKRDSYKSFGFVSDAASLLSNSDSVLGRDGVKESIAGYERLFSGARKNVGTTTTADSIQHREKEYATMVNSFYDLVTDFYEWGWGQVSYSCLYALICLDIMTVPLTKCWVYYLYSPFILHPA